MNTNDGGPAFPVDLRDWFAGMAMAGIFANGELAKTIAMLAKEGRTELDSHIPKMSYEAADAMLRERERRPRWLSD